ncbi:MAG: hypothetical protein EZS28_049491, partial [Streblomastix strix]
SYYSEHRVSTLSGVQIREDRLHILGDALRSSNNTSDIHENAQIGDNGSEKEMEITNIGICGRHTITELGFVDVKIGNNGNQELLNESGMTNSGGQELHGADLIIQIPGQPMGNKGDYLLTNSGQEKMHAQGVKINDEQGQEQRKDLSKKISKFNWRNPIYRSTMETRASTRKIVGSSEELDCKLERLEQFSSIDTVADERSKLVMGNNSNRCLYRMLKNNAEDSLIREENCMGTLEYSQAQIIQRKRASNNHSYNSKIFVDVAKRTFGYHQSSNGQQSGDVQYKQQQSSSCSSQFSEQYTLLSRAARIESQSLLYNGNNEQRAGQFVRTGLYMEL